jgi:hypothetical protein
MGEAKRRKQRGDTPIRVEDFRVGEGNVAFTLDLAGVEPTTVSIPAAELPEILSLIRRVFNMTADHSTDIGLHSVMRRAMIDLTKQARTSQDPEVGTQLIGVAAFCTLFHPASGAEFRSRISDSLRQDGKAHVTISCDARLKFAFLLAERFVDMEDAIAAMPADAAGSVAITRSRPKNKFH